MKILHVITSLLTGGAEKLMVDLLPELRNLGNDVDLLIFNGEKTPFYEQLEKTGITIHHLQAKGNVYNPLNIFRLMKYMNKYDVIHTHNTACQFFVPIAKLLTSTKANLVTTEHSSINRRRNNSLLKPIDKWMYGRYKKIICISDQTESNLKKHIGNRDNITTIYNGVDISKFINPVIPIKDSGNITITMVAGFRVGKDQDTLIRAMELLPDKYKLNLVGDGIRRPEIEELINKLSLNNRVSLSGVRNDIPIILKNSDVIVLSSHWEGLSLSSIEGMASGKPFIASDVDGIHEIVNSYGILFPDGDKKALANAIEDICNNSNRYITVARSCQEKAKQYDISIMAEKYKNLYDELYALPH